MCRLGVVMGHTSFLFSADVEVWLTWRCPWSSVPLTVDFILRLDRILRFVAINAFMFATLLLRDPSDLSDYRIDLKITTLTVLVIILLCVDKNFTY